MDSPCHRGSLLSLLLNQRAVDHLTLGRRQPERPRDHACRARGVRHGAFGGGAARVMDDIAPNRASCGAWSCRKWSAQRRRFRRRRSSTPARRCERPPRDHGSGRRLRRNGLDQTILDLSADDGLRIAENGRRPPPAEHEAKRRGTHNFDHGGTQMLGDSDANATCGACSWNVRDDLAAERCRRELGSRAARRQGIRDRGAANCRGDATWLRAGTEIVGMTDIVGGAIATTRGADRIYDADHRSCRHGSADAQTRVGDRRRARRSAGFRAARCAGRHLEPAPAGAAIEPQRRYRRRVDRRTAR